MTVGIVKRWVPDRKFGILAGTDGNDLYAPFANIVAAPVGPDGTITLPEGARVVFGTEEGDPKGPRATHVRVIERGVEAYWAVMPDSDGQLVSKEMSDHRLLDQFHELLRAIADGGLSVSELGGMHLWSDAIVDLAPRVDGRAVLVDWASPGAVFVGSAVFSGVSFRGDASFAGVTFEEEARFNGVNFMGNALFDGATFSGSSTFGGAGFGGGCWFSGATFAGDVTFNGGEVHGQSVFDGATFSGTALFMRRNFLGAVSFENEATFERTARFDEATCQDGVSFQDTRFAGETRFFGAKFQGNCSFDGAIFGRDCNFATAQFDCDELILDNVAFPDRLTIAGTAKWLSCRRTRFLSGASIRLDGATADLTEAEFTRPSALSGHGIRILSIKDAYVRDLTLAGADLSRCRFVGAQSLDALNVRNSSFASSPAGWRWSPRDVILEECIWRHWPAPTGKLSEYEARLAADPVPEARQISAVYRDLRKSREDGKDEPGAAGFYYGEMEMRRHASRMSVGGVTSALSFWAERGVLWAYWLLSGYALRASRALAALLCTIVAGGALLYRFGLSPQPSFSEALILSVQTISSLLRPIQNTTHVLTSNGQIVDIVLRLLGPVFLGLFLLSLRGRVKR